jgi:hypothetical protein
MTHEPEFNDSHEPRMVGHRMVSEQGAVIGRVNDVLVDDTAVSDAWAIVDPGLMRPERFVPLAAAYVADDGDVVVPYDKNTVKHAPRADDHVLTPAVREELAAYYGAPS